MQDSKNQLRERVSQYGMEGMGDFDLLAATLNYGVSEMVALDIAHQLRKKFKTLRKVADATTAELCQAGLTQARAAQVRAAFGLGRRFAGQARERGASLRSPSDVAEFMAPKIGHLGHEEMYVLVVQGSKNKLVEWERMFVGGFGELHAYAARIFQFVLAAGSHSFILVHNHPGGISTPSAADYSTTRKLITSAKIVELDLLDHVVVCESGEYASIRQLAPSCWGGA